ncbi:molybdopterin-binding protein [Salinisphaera sp. Q1T1-3]|uniref:molybdopterin-binding protein n=1 Tax=Salinisphaera sp. Q1T1-3 TaxID=2321229 RepID=UPI000E718ABC|nr:molybdopterin-binding protein [Salinisphaera sp. Q1T1-3]RJS94794.1 molybdopterin-binding protein [Salinisphaera sp. Q1T1-3]
MSDDRTVPRPGAVNPARRRLLRGIGALGATGLLAGCDWTQSQPVQDALSRTQDLTQAAMRLVSSREALAREYPARDIAPEFRANGSIQPQSDVYRSLLADGFADYRLGVHGAVTTPMQFSLADLKAMPSRTQITRHDCVEGWSCIGQWTGVPLAHVLERVGPTDRARFVVFHCADHLYNAPQPYYESLDMIEAHHPQTLLAYGLNGADLPVANGAPIRLRAERQLGYKMAKYVMNIELVESFDHIQGGKGGYWEDRGYNWWAGI